MKVSAHQVPPLALGASEPENAAPAGVGVSSSPPVAADATAGSSLMLKEQEGHVRAQHFKRNLEGGAGPNPSTPRGAGTGEHGFHTTPHKLGVLPADVNTGCKKPPLAPPEKKSRRDRGAHTAALNLGRNLQLVPQTGGEEDFTLRADGYLSGNRDAFTIDVASDPRTVAGKAVKFDGRHYVYLEKNIGNPASAKYAHGGVLEKSADGTWRVRQRYAPAMSLSLAGRSMNLPRDEIKRLEKLVRDGQLNDFFRKGDFHSVRNIADQWTRGYPRWVHGWEQDAKRFGNHEGKLPIEQSTLELTCRDDRFNRGEVRLVLDQRGHLLFTPDHYRSFILLTPSSPASVHINALPMAAPSRGGRQFDPYHLARFLLSQRVNALAGMLGEQGVFDGKLSHQLQEISRTEFDRLQSDLGRNLLPGFSLEHCGRVSGTGMVVALPPSHDGSGSPRVFVEGYVGTRFSEVVSDKHAEASLAYFKV